jgi:hypothetical protein
MGGKLDICRYLFIYSYTDLATKATQYFYL